MDFGSLSSLDDTDSDCPYHEIRKSRLVILTITAPLILLDLPPSEEAPPRPPGLIRMQEVEIQTEIDLGSYDVGCETDPLGMKSIGICADLPPSCVSPHYDEPALEVILRHLSLRIHQKELEQWLLDSPTEETSFAIKPVTKGTQRILRAVYNKRHRAFVLLLRCGEELFLELRSFSNLLKSVSIHVDKLEEGGKYHLETAGDLVSVIGGGSLNFFSLATLRETTRMGSTQVASALFFSDGIGYCSQNGEIYRIQDNLSRLNVTLRGGSYLITVDGGIAIVDSKSPLDYEFFEYPFEKPRIIYCWNEVLTVFDKSLQICVIFEAMSPRRPSHVVRFASSEYTVDVALWQSSLYSLTSGGIISKWKLLPNGRHIRELVLLSRLSHCKRLLHTSPQKFAIQTSDCLCFVIFSEGALVSC